jgi:hypothetical protein
MVFHPLLDMQAQHNLWGETCFNLAENVYLWFLL